MIDALGILETTGFTPAMVALDGMVKTAGVRVLQAELNDFLGTVVKILGPPAAVEAAIEAGRAVAQQMGGRPVTNVINRPDQRAWAAIESPREVSPLIQQDVVLFPAAESVTAAHQQLQPKRMPALAETPSYALGFIETQGFTAVFEAIDSACKAANVDIVCKEKLGGGYVTVVIKGDVAAVKAAIEAGKPKVDGLGKLIAAHVIARPSDQVLSLLPKL